MIWKAAQIIYERLHIWLLIADLSDMGRVRDIIEITEGFLQRNLLDAEVCFVLEKPRYKRGVTDDFLSSCLVKLMNCLFYDCLMIAGASSQQLVFNLFRPL